MYVLIISRGYPTLKYKLNGIFEFDQAKALVRAGCKVVFATVDIRSIRRWRKWGIERHDIEGVHVRVINIPVGRLPRIFLNKMTSIGLGILYNHILKEFGKPDVLHAHFTGIGYAASKLKKHFNIPLVITEHSSLVMAPTIGRQLCNNAADTYRKADAILAVSPALIKVIEKNFNIKPIYVPNIVDTDLFSYKPRGSNKLFNFVSTGNLIYHKRMELVIKAFYNAFGDNLNVNLTIFGEGSERPVIEGLIKKYGLKNRVLLMGMCHRKSIAEKLRESDCFVLASKSETFGVAYIEALACGIPVIATKCGGPEEFVNEDNGFLIPIDNIDALTDAMWYMYKNSMSFDRQKISDDIKSKYSPECVANQLVKIYQTISCIEAR